MSCRTVTIGIFLVIGYTSYLHLLADNLIVINKGNDDGFAAKIGVGFVF